MRRPRKPKLPTARLPLASKDEQIAWLERLRDGMSRGGLVLVWLPQGAVLDQVHDRASRLFQIPEVWQNALLLRRPL